MTAMTYQYDDADRDPGYETTECPDCEGAGYICGDCGLPTDNKFDCEHCRSTWIYRCKTCDGSGEV